MKIYSSLDKLRTIVAIVTSRMLKWTSLGRQGPWQPGHLGTTVAIITHMRLKGTSKGKQSPWKPGHLRTTADIVTSRSEILKGDEGP